MGSDRNRTYRVTETGFKFHVDEWILYAPFPDAKDENLRKTRQKAVILYVYYDDRDRCNRYRIFINMHGKTINTTEDKLFPL